MYEKRGETSGLDSKSSRYSKSGGRRFRQTNLAEADRDRKKNRMDMKRDVYMEMAPAIQLSATHLTEFMRTDEPLEKIQKGIRIRQRKIQQSIAKLIPIASDDVLDAMRTLQAYIVAAQVKLLKARIAFDATKNKEMPNGSIDAAKVLFEAWSREVEGYPHLMADLASSVRNDLEMPFDRARFEDGMKGTNNKIIQMFRDQLLFNE